MEDDQRAPAGMATLIASIFVDIDQWSNLDSQSYARKKILYQNRLEVF